MASTRRASTAARRLQDRDTDTCRGHGLVILDASTAARRLQDRDWCRRLLAGCRTRRINGSATPSRSRRFGRGGGRARRTHASTAARRLQDRDDASPAHRWRGVPPHQRQRDAFKIATRRSRDSVTQWGAINGIATPSRSRQRWINESKNNSGLQQRQRDAFKIATRPTSARPQPVGTATTAARRLQDRDAVQSRHPTTTQQRS